MLSGNVSIQSRLLLAQCDRAIPEFGSARFHCTGPDQRQQPRHTGIRSTTSIARLAQLLALTSTPLIRVDDEDLLKDGQWSRWSEGHEYRRSCTGGLDVECLVRSNDLQWP